MKKKKSLVDRFWSKFKRPKGKCWNWLASLDTSGYGLIRESHGSRNCSTTHKAHRLSWMLFNGPIPDGLYVLHKCDNPKCVNPGHLFLGTALDNAQDRDKKGRFVNHYAL